MSEYDPTDPEPKHAILGPSAAERWIACPASIRAQAALPSRPSSAYADEGTAAHALAEIIINEEILGKEDHPIEVAVWRDRYDIDRDTYEEMLQYVNIYVAFVKERLAAYPHSVLLVEQRVETGIPSCWGTSDVVIVSPDHVEIIDLKYGIGVYVPAEDNPQLMLYGVGALEAFGDLFGTPKEVLMSICQPRIEHTSTAVIDPDELREWRDSIIPVAELALGDDAPFGPSEEACRWCAARGLCAAQKDWSLKQDFGAVDLLDLDELAEALAMVPAIKQWCAAVEDQALKIAYSDRKQIPGWKVVRSNGIRFITDEATAIKALRAAGYKLKDITKPQAILGIGALEKLLGKGLPGLEEYVSKTEGKISLVPESDKKPAIDPGSEAAAEFAEEDVEDA